MSDPLSLDAARERIRTAYDPELLRTAGQRLIGQLADHLAEAERGAGVVLPWQPPPEKIAAARQVLEAALPPGASPAALAERFSAVVGTMLAHGNNLHDPRYIGHQVPAPVPLGGLFDAVGSVTNQVMAIYEMGPWATAVEWAMVQQLGQQIGWRPGEFSGLVTHGGSLANLTALLTARNVALRDAWECGLPRSGPPPVLVVQADAHYCVSRSAGIVGLGTQPGAPRGPGRPAADGPAAAGRTARRRCAAGTSPWWR